VIVSVAYYLRGGSIPLVSYSFPNLPLRLFSQSIVQLNLSLIHSSTAAFTHPFFCVPH